MNMAVVNVTHNIQPDIKESVEKNCEILQKMKTRDSITEAEIGKTMTIGLTQAKEDDSLTVEETFSNLRMGSME